MSMKATQWDQFKATPKNAAFGFAFGVLPIGLFWYLIARDKVGWIRNFMLKEKNMLLYLVIWDLISWFRISLENFLTKVNDSNEFSAQQLLPPTNVD